MIDQPAHLRRDYPHTLPLTTRWHDNDLYGHVNSATYYAYFESAVTAYLIKEGGLNILRGEEVGVVTQSSCDFFAPIAFPETVEIGVRVVKLAECSVQYEVAVFKEGEKEACAAGRMAHAFRDRAHNKPVPVPERLRKALTALQHKK